MPTYSADGESVSFGFEELFPGSNETATITGHGDTVTVGDLVEVTFRDSRGAVPETFFKGKDSPGRTQVVITGIHARSDGHTTVYAKNPEALQFLPTQFGIGQVRGGWWRTFKKIGA